MRFLCVLILLPVALGQSTSRTNARLAQNAWIRGRVVNDVNGKSLNRARVLLRSLTSEAPSLAVDADEQGSFIIPNVASGRYSISAQREGFLSGTTALSGAIRLPAEISIETGHDLDDVTLRLRPCAVVSGRVRFGDAEAASGVVMRVYRDAWVRGRRSLTLVSTGRTDDRGEYRVGGLEPGSYYIAASYDRPLAQGYQQQEPVDQSGKPVRRTGYPTMFYPDALALSDAISVRVASGQESEGLDIFLQPAQTVSVRGRVLSGLSGQPVRGPSVTLRRLASDQRASINASVSVTPSPGGFEIRGVGPGPYLLVVDSVENGKRMFARRPLVVTDGDIGGLEVTLEPAHVWRGVVKLTDAPNTKVGTLRVTLEPRSDLNPVATASVAKDGSFTVTVVPGEVYDAYIANASEDAFIQSIRVGNSLVGAEGISGRASDGSVPLEIMLSERDSFLGGKVSNSSGEPVPGSSVTVVPEPLQGRPQLVRTAVADQFGQFQVRGLAPGAYTAFAYTDEPPCPFYDDQAMAECRIQGTTFTVGESAQAVVSLRLAQ